MGRPASIHATADTYSTYIFPELTSNLKAVPEHVAVTFTNEGKAKCVQILLDPQLFPGFTEYVCVGSGTHKMLADYRAQLEFQKTAGMALSNDLMRARMEIDDIKLSIEEKVTERLQVGLESLRQEHAIEIEKFKSCASKAVKMASEAKDKAKNQQQIQGELIEKKTKALLKYEKLVEKMNCEIQELSDKKDKISKKAAQKGIPVKVTEVSDEEVVLSDIDSEEEMPPPDPKSNKKKVETKSNRVAFIRKGIEK
jgi:hypothetical protein